MGHFQVRKLLVIPRGYSKMARDWDLGCSNIFQLFPSRDLHIIHGLCIAASMNSIDKAPCATWARARLVPWDRYAWQ